MSEEPKCMWVVHDRVFPDDPIVGKTPRELEEEFGVEVEVYVGFWHLFAHAIGCAEPMEKEMKIQPYAHIKVSGAQENVRNFLQYLVDARTKQETDE